MQMSFLNAELCEGYDGCRKKCVLGELICQVQYYELVCGQGSVGAAVHFPQGNGPGFSLQRFTTGMIIHAKYKQAINHLASVLFQIRVEDSMTSFQGSAVSELFSR